MATKPRPPDAEEKEPDSVPAILSESQAQTVRTKLDSYCQGKRKAAVATSLDTNEVYLNGVLDRQIKASVSFAVKFAEMIGTDLEGLLDPKREV